MKKTLPLTTGVLACDVLEEEVKARMERMGLRVHRLQFLPMGEHDYPDRLRGKLQAAITEMEQAGCERILLVYGLCSNSILGLRTERAELILPRAHDCITLLLGSRERYEAAVRAEPQTYWFSPGWCRGKRVPGAGYFKRQEAQFREQFDEEEVEYLMETLKETYSAYRKAGYTDLGDGDTATAREDARKSAAELGMEFEEFPGDDGLLRRLLAGPWNEAEFLVVPPGKTAAYTGDGAILACRDCPACGGENNARAGEPS